MGLSWVAVQKAQAKFPLAFNPSTLGDRSTTSRPNICIFNRQRFLFSIGSLRNGFIYIDKNSLCSPICYQGGH